MCNVWQGESSATSKEVERGTKPKIAPAGDLDYIEKGKG